MIAHLVALFSAGNILGHAAVFPIHQGTKGTQLFSRSERSCVPFSFLVSSERANIHRTRSSKTAPKSIARAA